MSDFRHPLFIIGVALLAMLTVSCSSKPSGPTPGTPEFFWAASAEAYKNGDYMKTYENLGNVVRKKNDYSDRGHIWLVAVAGGITQGLMDLNKTLETGMRAARDQSPAFRRQMGNIRNTANASTLQFVESVHEFLKVNKDESIKLSFTMPPVNPPDPPLLARAAKGMVLQPPELELAQKTMVQRGVVQTAANFVGAKGDVAKAKAVFDQAEPVVSRPVFLTAVAESLYNAAELYSGKQLDQPQRAKVLYDEALEALGTIPVTAETKKLKAKIEEAMKKLRLNPS